MTEQTIDTQNFANNLISIVGLTAKCVIELLLIFKTHQNSSSLKLVKLFNELS